MPKFLLEFDMDFDRLAEMCRTFEDTYGRTPCPVGEAKCPLGNVCCSIKSEHWKRIAYIQTIKKAEDHA